MLRVCTLRKHSPKPWLPRGIATMPRLPRRSYCSGKLRFRESATSAKSEDSDQLSYALLERAKGFIPALSSEKYKGQAGKIGVIGGCTEYTGAPFYAAMAALRCGADLSHVFCTRGAGSVIKTYSPELIVHPYLYEEEDAESGSKAGLLKEQAIRKTCEWLPKLSCLVIGPGLGRDPLVLETVNAIMQKAACDNIPMVIDADGLWIWSQDSYDTSPIYSPNGTEQKIVLTPNAVEMQRLAKRHGITNAALEEKKRENVGQCLLEELSDALVIVEKGRHDLIHGRMQEGEGEGEGTALDGNLCSISTRNKSSLKRCGGQGDILSGCIATFLSWGNAAKARREISGEDWKLVAAYAGSYLTREASRRAFRKHGRAMVCTDVIEEVGPAFSSVFPDDESSEPEPES